MENRTAPHAADEPEVPIGLRNPSTAELGSLRMRIFEEIRSGDMAGFLGLLPDYALMLNQLLAGCAQDRSIGMRLESDHLTFFEQVKAVLVTNRIQLRLELERVSASRRYARVSPAEPIGRWQG